MAEDSNPLTLLPKKPRLTTDWSECVVCQRSTQEKLTTATSDGLKRFHDASHSRKDHVYQRLQPMDIDE